MLNQAMIGSISDNFRMVTLKWTSDGWLVEVVLAERSDEDEEEVIEIADQMSIFLMDIQDYISKEAEARIETNVIFSKEPLSFQCKELERVVFKKKN